MKTNFQKGYVVPLVIAIVVLAIAGGVYYISTKSSVSSVGSVEDLSSVQEASSTQIIGGDRDAHGCLGPAGYLWSEQKQQCVRPWEENASSTSNDPAEPQPVITSISPSSGPIGTTIELKGNNLAGFEGDLNAWIENSNGEKAFLMGIGSVPRADATIRVKIEGQLCKEDLSYKGGTCTSFMKITPGTYSIYTIPWSKISNKVKFTVTALNSQVSLIKKIFSGFSVRYPNNWTILSQDQYPNFSVVAFTTDKNGRASVTFTGDQTQIGAILKTGPVAGGVDDSKTKRTEFNERGLRVIKWDYVFVGDAGSGVKDRSVWVVLRSCNIDTVFLIDDVTLFSNFALIDANGNESGSSKFSLCSI